MQIDPAAVLVFALGVAPSPETPATRLLHAQLPPACPSIVSLEPGDFDGDGDQDLVWSTPLRVLFNDGGTDASNLRNLPHLAATAVTFGFPREKAVAAMTLEPARLLGVSDRVGSLEPGKDATFLITDGDILDLRSHVVGAYLDGRALDLTDKQKRLYERYRARPKPTAPAARRDER